MKQLFTILLIAVFCFLITNESNGQVVSVTNPTNTTPNLAATYGSLSAALTDLNTITAISGPVTITLNAGNPQTAPAGGYTISFTAATTAVNNVTITGSNNTITAFTPQTTGSITDAIFKIIGSDYVTLQNFTMQENGANATTPIATNNMTEWGVGLFYASATNGAQNNTIQNNTIVLNKIYGSTFGIYSNTNHTLATPNMSNQVTSVNGANSNNKVYGNNISNVNMGICFVGSLDVNYMDIGNDIGGSSVATGNTITNWGGLIQTYNYYSSSGSCYGINLDNQKDENVSYNTMTSAAVTGAPVSIRGILKDYNTSPTGTFTSNITNNTITINYGFTLGSTFDGIRCANAAGTIPNGTFNINSNLFLNNSISAASTPSFIGIINTCQVGVLNINNNIIQGTTSASPTGIFTGISNTGAVITTLNINNNQIGNASGNAITYSVANSSTLSGINCSAAASTAAVSISNNNFQGFVQSVPGTGTHLYISLVHGPSTGITDNINSNTFTNLVANTSGNVTFISATGAMTGTGATKNCNNNSIVTAFSKPVSTGTVALFNSTSASLSGNTMVHTGNDFSNITLTGTTAMNGWNNSEGGTSGPTKTINNNIFNNWTGGSGSVFVIQSDAGGDNSTVTGNDIQNINGTGFVTAIAVGASSKLSHTVAGNTIAAIAAGNTLLGLVAGSTSITQCAISGNNIHTLSSTGASQVEGIRTTAFSTANATINISKNKIYDLSNSNSDPLVFGINMLNSTVNGTYNVSNNYIGDLRAINANVTLALRGINVPSIASPSTYNIYYNTIYINAVSSGTNFGTTALFLASSGTATIGATTLRNNILINTSTPNGTGLTTVCRRNLQTLANYSTASNNNIFYAGNPSLANRFLYYDATTGYQTLAAFKAAVSTREANSFTELPPFLSTSGASANFLHIDPAIPTQAESGANNITGYTDDYDANIRQGNAGYAGTGTAPDIGADEFEGIYSELTPPVITYTTITTPTCTYSGTTLTGVNITDVTGIPLTGVNRPRVYYRRNAGTWFSQPGTNTSGTATNSNWNFAIVDTDMGTLTGGDVISYYIIAQDLNPVANVGSNPSAGLVAASVNSITTHPTSPNTYTLRYNLSGTYTVGVTGNFPTLTAAVDAYNNACSLAGATIFELIDNSYGSETFPIAINFRADANSTNSLTVRPSATATPVITGSSATQIINLNGARYITFDGRQAGLGTTKSFTLVNTGSGVTFQFINDAKNANLRYCILKGQRAGPFSGTVNFSTSNVTGTGNDNISVDNNDIGDSGSGFSNCGIFSSGTSGRENDGISILNNNIYNYYNAASQSAGIFISAGSEGWIISGNRLFQTATRLYTSPVIHFGIYVITGTGYTISNNVIGFADAAGNGTTNMIGNSVTLTGFPASYAVSGTAVAIRYAAIFGSFTIGTTSTIDGNTIGGFAMYTSANSPTLFGIFGGINIESGIVNIGSIAGNTIGSTTGNNSIYVATSGMGGAVVGIRASCYLASAIQNNMIGSITASGTSAAVSGAFTGINTAGACSFNVSNNSIGNADADNIRIGFTTSGANLSNAGSLTATNAGVNAVVKGINSSSTGNTLAVNNNTLRGWAISSRSTPNMAGIETTGAMILGSPSLDINNNSLGTAATNWVNAIVDNTGALYGLNISNTGAAVSNIKNNDFRGTMFGTQNAVGGGLIRITGATAANGIATISGNTFTNLAFRFSTGDLYFIYTNYSIPSTGQLIIDNNRIVGTFNGTGASTYHMISCLMGSASGAKADITNNDFSNVTAATGFGSNISGIYTHFSSGPCLLNVSNNTLNNWSSGTGGINGIEISDMTGTASCSNNIVSNISTQGSVQGLSFSSGASSGQFDMMNNDVFNIASTGLGGFIDGTAIYMPTITNTAQLNIYNNNIHSFSSSSAIGVISGLHLHDGNISTTVSFTANKIYDLLESSSGGRVYGIYNQNAISGNITYKNNYIGDLRAPLSSVTGPSIAGIRIFMVGGQSNIYYNTIHLNATGSASTFSTAAVYTDVASQVILRNNILSNVSVPGASGRTVAFWRTGTSLATYDAASNNNLIYAGATSSQNLVFYDGTNSDQTLAAYQARVSPRDSASASGAQNFISIIGADANFLHIAATGNCSVNARGNNSGILLATDYDADIRSIVFPFVTDIGADEFSKKNAWTGTNGTSWNDTGNWSEGVVPNTTDDNVVISTPPVNQPVITSGQTFQVASVILGTGASLTNRGNLKIAGSIYANAASVNNIQAGVVEGSVEMNGNCSIVQQLSGDVFVNNSVKDFKVSNDVTLSATAGRHLNIIGALSFGGTGKTLLTNDNIVLVSTFNKTANVEDVTGNLITGKATVERYLNTGLVADGRHLKSWQFLATPTVGQTIFESWQEGGTSPAGYGTIITGTGSGFDITTAQPSMKFYDSNTSNWLPVTNTGNPINDKRGYMLFVRGDRTVTAYNQDAVPTTLRTKGNLYQPSAPPPVSTVPAGKFESVGNPYASAIDVSYMKDNGLFINLNNDVTVWDPLLAGTFAYGGYQTLSASNNYEPTAGGTAYYPSGVSSPYIQSSQAFFVHSSGLAGSVTFNENCKESSSRMVYRAGTINQGRQFFRVSLFTPEGIIADGNAVAFDRNFSNNIDKDDAYKVMNTGENFGLTRSNKSLAVEARMPVSRTDTIFYNMFNLRKQAYQLRFAPKNMQSGLKAFLIDKYLHTTTELSTGDSSFIDIVINNDALSYASDRFYVVFRHQAAVNNPIPQIPPVKSFAKTSTNINQMPGAGSISVYPNPVENKALRIHFKNQQAGTYHIFLTNSLGQFVYDANVEINGNSAVKNVVVPGSTGPGTYNLTIIAASGETKTIEVLIK